MLNGVNFLITALQDSDTAFGNVVTLMERICAFLETLSLFVDGPGGHIELDIRLRNTVYKVLEHFLKIMTLAYRLMTNRRSKMKLVGRQLVMGNDKGIRDSLTQLEALIPDVT